MKELSLNTILNWFDQRNIDMEWHKAGMDNEKDVLVADWNDVSDAWQRYLERFYESDWYDESTYCIECYGHIHTTPAYYGDTPKYIHDEYGAVCKNCIMKSPEDYLEQLTFWSDSLPVYPSAIPNWLIPELEKNGFVPFHFIDTACKDLFESGLHTGQTDTTEKVAALIHEKLGLCEMLFCIDSTGQFDVHFSAYIKKDSLN